MSLWPRVYLLWSLTWVLWRTWGRPQVQGFAFEQQELTLVSQSRAFLVLSVPDWNKGSGAKATVTVSLSTVSPICNIHLWATQQTLQPSSPSVTPRKKTCVLWSAVFSNVLRIFLRHKHCKLSRSSTNNFCYYFKFVSVHFLQLQLNAWNTPKPPFLLTDTGTESRNCCLVSEEAFDGRSLVSLLEMTRSFQ